MMKKPTILLFCMMMALLLLSFPAANAGASGNFPIANYFFVTVSPSPTIGTIQAFPFRAPTPASTSWIPEETSLFITPTPAPTPNKTPRKTVAPTPSPVSVQGEPVFTSFGLYWQEMLPRLTDDWYMFTPLDLNEEGEQIFPLVASNAWIIGQVRLKLAGGTLRVDCELTDGVKILSEFLTFFPDLDSVKTLSLPLLEDQNYPFRTPLSIQSTFGGDRQVLMYIHNGVKYEPSIPGLSVFDLDLFRPWMKDMLKLLD